MASICFHKHILLEYSGLQLAIKESDGRWSYQDYDNAIKCYDVESPTYAFCLDCNRFLSFQEIRDLEV